MCEHICVRIDYIHDKYPKTICRLWYLYILSAVACLGSGIAATFYDKNSAYTYGLVIYGIVGIITVIAIYLIELLNWCLNTN